MPLAIRTVSSFCFTLIAVCCADVSEQQIEQELVVAKAVSDLLQPSPQGMNQIMQNIELATQFAKNAGTSAAKGCAVGALMGSVGGPTGIVAGCNGGALISAAATIASDLHEHLSEQMHKAVFTWKIFVASLTKLQISKAEKDKIKRKFRACLLEHHPDKWPAGLNEIEQRAEYKIFADCKFAAQFLLKFVQIYGNTFRLGDERPFYLHFAGRLAVIDAGLFGGKAAITEEEIDKYMGGAQYFPGNDADALLKAYRSKNHGFFSWLFSGSRSEL